MALTQNLREYIVAECSEKYKPTLTDIIYRFDMHQHAILNLDELNNALKSIDSIVVTRKENEIIFSMRGSDTKNIEITKNDLSEAYKKYTENIN